MAETRVRAVTEWAIIAGRRALHRHAWRCLAKEAR
jgi:hypothetical protein